MRGSACPIIQVLPGTGSFIKWFIKNSSYGNTFIIWKKLFPYKELLDHNIFDPSYVVKSALE